MRKVDYKNSQKRDETKMLKKVNTNMLLGNIGSINYNNINKITTIQHHVIHTSTCNNNIAVIISINKDTVCSSYKQKYNNGLIIKQQKKREMCNNSLKTKAALTRVQ